MGVSKVKINWRKFLQIDLGTLSFINIVHSNNSNIGKIYKFMVKKTT